MCGEKNKMKIVVDEKNRCVIATGTYKNKRVKAVAVCHPEDEFDVEKGKEIAKAKYKIRYEMARMEEHQRIVRRLTKFINWAYLVIADESRIIDNFHEKIYKLEKKL